jgi:hypothetical protein
LLFGKIQQVFEHRGVVITVDTGRENDISEIRPLLGIFKHKSNRRPNMAFGYMSPLEKLAEFLRQKRVVEEIFTERGGTVNVGDV